MLLSNVKNTNFYDNPKLIRAFCHRTAREAPAGDSKVNFGKAAIYRQ